MAYRSLPSLQTLLAFEASVRLSSFTRAAEELALTQGAVSQHIRALEARLGTDLFQRERLGAIPTDAARQLAVEVRQGLGVLERAFRVPSRTSSSGATVLRLSTLPSVARHWLALRLPDFQRLHPEIRVRLDTGADLARFDRDGTDVALRYGPGNWSGVRCEKLADETVFPVASPEYRNGRLPRRRSELADCTLLRHRAQPWELWFQAARLALDEPVHGPLFNDLDDYLRAAEEGRGIALARGRLVEAALSERRLVRLWKTQARDIHAYYLVWSPGSAKLDVIDTFRAWLHRQFL